MKKSITKTIGKEKHVFQVEGANFFQVVMEAQKLSFPDVHKCGICGSDSLTLGAHKAQGKHEYGHITCRDCRGYVNFGKQQENPEVYFLRLKKDENGNTMKGKDGRSMFDWQKYSREEKE